MTAEMTPFQKTYEQNGFVELPGVMTPDELTNTHAEIEAIWARVDQTQDQQWLHWRDHAELGRVADRLDPVSKLSPYFAELMMSEKLRGPAEELLGGPVYVLKDKLIMKQPGTAGYGAHQDLPYWDNFGLGVDDTLTTAITLCDIGPEHGPLMLYPELHRDRMPADPRDPLDVDPEALKAHTPHHAPYKAGDAIYFHALVPHYSAANTAATPRTMYLVTYARDHGEHRKMIAGYRSQLDRVHAVHRREATTP